MAQDYEAKGADLPHLTLIIHQRPEEGRVVCQTWGTRQGKYQQLGSVTIARPEQVQVETLEHLARVVLWGLYGGDYDL